MSMPEFAAVTKGRQMLHSFFWLGWWTFGLGLFAALLLRGWAEFDFLLVRIVNYLLPWFLAVLIPGLAVALMTQRRGLAVLLAACALYIAAVHAPLFLSHPAAEPPPPGSLRLKVMSYNVWSRNSRVAEMAAVIRRERPDILLIQEIPPETFTLLIAALTDLYPDADLHFRYAPSLLQAVLSRYPLSAEEVMRKKGQAQKVIAATPAGAVSVFNVHPLRRGGWGRRHEQIRSLLEEEIVQRREPTILGGDFNTTDQTPTFRLINRYLRNSHREAGFGFGFTWPAADHKLLRGLPLPALVRIDHIFYSAHFRAEAAGTLPDSGGSDHRPIIVILSFLPPTP